MKGRHPESVLAHHKKGNGCAVHNGAKPSHKDRPLAGITAGTIHPQVSRKYRGNYRYCRLCHARIHRGQDRPLAAPRARRPLHQVVDNQRCPKVVEPGLQTGIKAQGKRRASGMASDGQHQSAPETYGHLGEQSLRRCRVEHRSNGPKITSKMTPKIVDSVNVASPSDPVAPCRPGWAARAGSRPRRGSGWCTARRAGHRSSRRRPRARSASPRTTERLLTRRPAPEGPGPGADPGAVGPPARRGSGRP